MHITRPALRHPRLGAGSPVTIRRAPVTAPVADEPSSHDCVPTRVICVASTRHTHCGRAVPARRLLLEGGASRTAAGSPGPRRNGSCRDAQHYLYDYRRIHPMRVGILLGIAVGLMACAESTAPVAPLLVLDQPPALAAATEASSHITQPFNSSLL